MTPPTDEGGAWISSGQIYAELRRIGDEVSQLRVDLASVEQLRATVTTLRGEVEELKRARWPLPSLAALVAVAGLLLTLYQLATR